MTGATTVAVIAALLSASLFGLASALQHEQVHAVAPSRTPGLLVHLVKRPRWLVGMASDGLAVALQAVALGFGTVALVQPLLVAGLPVAVALSALFARRRLLHHETVGVLLCTAGLALLGPSTATTSDGREPSRVLSLVLGMVLFGVVVGLLAASRRHSRWASGAAGLAAGVVTGAASVLLAVTAARVGDLRALALSVAPYATVVVGLAGLWLAQTAFQTGALGAPLAALSVSEPVVSVVLAVTVLHETLPATGLARTGLVAGAALAVGGVVVLCRPVPELAPVAG